jgi:class 3 adenylate cyclase
VFTDVEGSTRLLDELGPAACADALAAHRRIVREAIARHGGSEVDTQGDAFFLAFAEPSAAVQAATAIHEELAPSTIRIRVGIHTGTALVTDEGYVGDAVHLAGESPPRRVAGRSCCRRRRASCSRPGARRSRSASTG